MKYFTITTPFTGSFQSNKYAESIEEICKFLGVKRENLIETKVEDGNTITYKWDLRWDITTNGKPAFTITCTEPKEKEEKKYSLEEILNFLNFEKNKKGNFVHPNGSNLLKSDIEVLKPDCLIRHVVDNLIGIGYRNGRLSIKESLIKINNKLKDIMETIN